jgi:hypothetical protein
MVEEASVMAANFLAQAEKRLRKQGLFVSWFCASLVLLGR